MPSKPFALKAVTFEKAVEAARKRKVELPGTYYGKMKGVERAQAFSVAHIAALDQLQQTLDSLNDALDQGMTFDDWRKEALKAPDVLALPKHRLDNIFRTNIQGAYARGRCQQIEATKDTRPMLMYSAVNDSRTRPHHAAMDGATAPQDHDIWKTWMPPAGYRCRCTVISVTQEKGEQLQKRDQERMEKDKPHASARFEAVINGPDDGWDYTPCDADDWTAGDKAPLYAQPLAAQTAQIDEEAERRRDALDPDRWTLVGAQKGSNPGGVYEAPDGTRYYVKEYAYGDQARSEYAANEINRLIGIDTPESLLLQKDGRLIIANKWRDDLREATLDELHKAKHKVELRRAYQAAALTKNWDVVGMDMDNLVLNGKGKLTIVDSGGSFRFRAQGGAKEFWGGPVDELETLLNPSLNQSAARVFGKYTKDELLVGMKNNLSDITKDKLKTIFRNAGFDPAERGELVEATWLRVKWMRELADSTNATKRSARGIYKGKVAAFKEAQKVTPAQARKAIEDLNGKLITDQLTRKAYEKKAGTVFEKIEDEYLANILNYTDTGYGDLNEALYTNAMTPELDEMRKALNAALVRAPKHTGSVRRGITLNEGLRKKWAAAAVDAQKNNKPIEFNAFMSTSKTKSFDGNVKINIVGKGHQGADIEAVSSFRREGEVLYASGSKFRVVRVKSHSTHGTLELWLEEDEKFLAVAPEAKLAISHQAD